MILDYLNGPIIVVPLRGKHESNYSFLIFLLVPTFSGAAAV